MRHPGRLVPRLAGMSVVLLGTSPAIAKEGMPQLNFANPLTVSQVAWGAVIFLVLYVLLARWALPGVGAVLETRREAIAQDLEAARHAKAAADAAIAELREARRRARAESQAAIDAAAAEAKTQAAAIAEAVNSRLEAQLGAAEARIAAAREAALGALQQVATETAVLVVQRLAGTAIPAARVEAAVIGVLHGQGGDLAVLAGR